MTYFKISAGYTYQSGVVTAYDAFTGTTAGAALNGRVAPMGGTWATSGAATDLAITDAGGERVSRSTVSDAGQRFAILGATNYADTEASVIVEHTGGAPEMSVIARWTNSSNLLVAAHNSGELVVVAVIAGAQSSLAHARVAIPVNTPCTLRLIAWATGHCVAEVLSRGVVIGRARGVHSALATGGALQTGKPGFSDFNPLGTASTRYYDDFYAATPPAEQLVVNSGRRIEIRHDSCERESADGTTWGTVQPRGGRVYVPCAGDEGRVTRLWVSAKRNDVTTMADGNIADSTKVKVTLRPRYRLPTNP